MRLALLLTALLGGCVFVPKTQTTYDAQCSIQRREMTLDVVTGGGNFGGCNGKECAILLAAVGAVAATSLVVSTSIVIVGNTVYWLERRGHCVAAG